MYTLFFLSASFALLHQYKYISHNLFLYPIDLTSSKTICAAGSLIQTSLSYLQFMYQYESFCSIGSFLLLSRAERRCRSATYRRTFLFIISPPRTLIVFPEPCECFGVRRRPPGMGTMGHSHRWRQMSQKNKTKQKDVAEAGAAEYHIA